MLRLNIWNTAFSDIGMMSENTTVTSWPTYSQCVCVADWLNVSSILYECGRATGRGGAF